ncbi:hypothetical protein QJS10_CPA01g01861 [Acorus calamus]|uniref:Uncharacterized protein n=1 Tax=Acorus calamus TaxID=4465 RepID=A0AAV9FMU8_ACOCL|nr:hypothetical protein QJS10_CPA01g01861 [Acorus calamus]
MVWTIWRTRNAVIFRSQLAYVENVWAEIGGLLKTWGCRLAGARNVGFQGHPLPTNLPCIKAGVQTTLSK